MAALAQQVFLRPCIRSLSPAHRILSVRQPSGVRASAVLPRCFGASTGQLRLPSAWCRNVFTHVPTSAKEIYEAGELARIPIAEISSANVRSALELFNSLPKLMLPQNQVSVIAQQLFRVFLSYQQWYLPRVARSDLPSDSALWSVGVRYPDAPPGGNQLLPLTSDDSAFESLTGRGVRDGADATVIKTAISGVQAVREHLHGQGRWEGLMLNPGEEGVIIRKEELPLLHMWEATLRCEALMSSELDDSPGPTGLQAPASDELADLLARQVKLSFVQMGDDLARNDSGQHIITLTSNDAAALCAIAYGKDMVRPVDPEKLLAMAEGAAGAFQGYALTLGADMAPFAPAGDTHIPRWRTREVTAEWMAATLGSQLSNGP
eukprot:TRINITY_DN45037_c0_g1_i1.p1 TRINITY_DN45037_c0_g1~~TRINITY_DN45037_c0_g1_i1.p1  ORF type:complete len:421 (+),score=41.11 TRINITY_DN45037_c0_g1_i1:132-1265(+)